MGREGMSRCPSGDDSICKVPATGIAGGLSGTSIFELILPALCMSSLASGHLIELSVLLIIFQLNSLGFIDTHSGCLQLNHKSCCGFRLCRVPGAMPRAVPVPACVSPSVLYAVG